ncbi:MAG: hypothetical protein J5682_05340 [Prevotella sp.]|nr:hypothetical protein [Prevotella sp.]
MLHPVELEGLVAIMFSLAIPIFAIVMGISKSIKKNENERIIREAIITNHTDPETAQLLIQNQEPKSNKFTALRWGCVLLGIGLGAAINALAHMDPKDDIYFWLILAAGCGIGFLASFIVETKMQKNDADKSDLPTDSTQTLN